MVDEKTNLLKNDEESCYRGDDTKLTPTSYSTHDERIDSALENDYIPPGEEALPSSITNHTYLIGTLLSVFAGITFTSANVIQKYAPNLNFWDLLFVRAVSQLIVIGGLSFWCGYNPIGPTGSRSRIYAQGFMGGVLLLCLFVAVKHIPLGDASAIFFSAPFFTMLFSSCMLNEHFGLFRISVSTIIIVGVLLLCRPPALFPPESLGSKLHNETGNFFGTICAWTVPILSAIITILNRQCKHVPFLVLTFWFGVGALFVSLIGMNIPFLHSSNVYSGNIFNFSPLEWVYTATIVTLGIIGNIVMTIALKFISPARAMVFRSFEVIANYILQATLFSKVAMPFHVTDPIGALLIVISVMLMGLETMIQKRYSWKYL
uniref:EamA domain-containing protein n=1 Tax=Lepeophtheirus salmonis TaxID=72036 RepID=A0A0K2TSL4_LEPSM